MPRLIDANKLKTKAIADPDSGEGIVYVQDIDESPTVDAVEVKHGRWKNNHCTVCGMMPMGEELWEHLVDCEPPRMERFMDYCPNCGAKMDGDGNG